MTPDLIVLGGGPAGAISAWLAARDGLSVWLVDPPDPRPRRLEGLSPRLAHWLAGQGLIEGLDGLHGPLIRRVDWSGIGASNHEHIVARPRLDAHLGRAAVAEGARAVRDSGHPAPGGVVLRQGGFVAAPRVIDARGRRASSAGRRGPATLALSAPLVATGAPGIDLRAAPTGWVWAVTPAAGIGWVQAITDAAGDPRPPEARLRSLLAAARIDPARLAGPVLVREAGCRLPAPAGPDLDCLAVGDALAAMDPLSGHGQFWAVSSALAAAAVRRTLDADPARAGLCHAFLADRAHQTALREARKGRDFIAAETRFADRPFWQARCAFPDSIPLEPAPPRTRTRMTCVVQDGLIDEREVLVTPHSPQGVGWFGRHPAAEVWRLWTAGGMPAMAQRWGPEAPALLAALHREGIA